MPTSKQWRDAHAAENRAFQAHRYARTRARIIVIKLGLACVDCGWRPITPEETKQLDFDHIDPTTKCQRRGGGAFLYSWGWDRIEAELALCEPRCKPCHRKRSSSEGHTITARSQ